MDILNNTSPPAVNMTDAEMRDHIYELTRGLRYALRANNETISTISRILSIIVRNLHLHHDGIAATDGENLWIGDEFFTFKPSEQAFILIHETYHVMLEHPWRGVKLSEMDPSGFDSYIYNIAGDLIINHIVMTYYVGATFVMNDKTLQVEKPSIGAFDEAVSLEDFTEELYMKLLSEKKNGGGRGGKGKEGQEGQEGQGQGKGETGGNLKRLLKPGALQGDIIPGTDTGEIRMKDAIIRTAREMAAGSGVGGLGNFVLQSIERPLINWRSLLRKYFFSSVTGRFDTTYNKINSPIYGATKGLIPKSPYGIVLPTFTGVSSSVDVAIDTSGSIDMDLVNKFITEFKNLVRQRISKGMLMLFHSEVYYRVPYPPFKLTEKDIQSGGTDVTQVLEYAKKDKVKLLVVMTDGYFSDPSDFKPTFAIIWLLTQPDSPEHPGINIRMK